MFLLLVPGDLILLGCAAGCGGSSVLQCIGCAGSSPLLPVSYVLPLAVTVFDTACCISSVPVFIAFSSTVFSLVQASIGRAAAGSGKCFSGVVVVELECPLSVSSTISLISPSWSSESVDFNSFSVYTDFDWFADFV